MRKKYRYRFKNGSGGCCLIEFTHKMQLDRRILLLRHLHGKGRVGQKNELTLFVPGEVSLFDPLEFFELLVVPVRGLYPAGLVDIDILV